MMKKKPVTYWPRPKGEKGKMAFLALLLKSHPGLFYDNGIYHFDPLAILEKNLHLQAQLEKMLSYRDLLQERGKLVQLDIAQKAKRVVTSVQLSAKALLSYQQNLQKRLSKMGRGPWPGGGCPLLERILCLVQSKDLCKLQHRPLTSSLWQELSDLVQIYVLIQGADGRMPDHTSEMRAALKKTSEAQLDYFIDQVTFERKMLPLNAILGKDKKLTIKKIIHHKMDLLMAKTETRKRKVKLSIVLQECSPFLGIYRGHYGQDCSTLYSSGYALDPTERVFSILRRGKKATCRGYVCATVVQVQGARALYVHTIAGPKVTGAEAQLILQGLYQKRRELGVEYLVLPALGQLDNLINYLDIKSTFKKLAKKAQKKRIRYRDTLIRQKIGEYVPAGISYDNPEANRTGYLFRPAEVQLQNVLVQMRPFCDPLEQKLPPLTLLDGQALALDFLKLGLKEQSARVAKVLGRQLDSLMRWHL